ncbi:MAG TPA: hypothetical protein VFZ40_11075 [Pyrinomonadaceae bacterium]
MPYVDPLPVEITIPEIPVEFSPEDIPEWTWEKPRIWIHEPIPLEIEFPITRPTEIPLRITIGMNTFVVPLALTAMAVAES